MKEYTDDKNKGIAKLILESQQNTRQVAADDQSAATTLRRVGAQANNVKI
jgi:hypothetical protein